MKTSEFMEHISDETPAGKRWEQTDDGWFNIWRCVRGNQRAFRPEKDGVPMVETTALGIFEKCCKNCYNQRGCKFYDLYR